MRIENNSGLVDGWLSGRMERKMDGLWEEWVDYWKNGWIIGRMGGLFDERTD